MTRRLKVNENWKGVIHSEENMADAMRYLMDDYLFLVNYWKENEDKEEDDATYVHVDAVKEEREELETKIDILERALHLRNEEYLALADKYKQLDKQVHNLNALLDIEEDKEEPVEPIKEVKRLVKRKKPLLNKKK